ncbi:MULTISPECIES: TonB-dependent receptor [unclassified Parabacteroides]|uniref:SusC/RagA family TonB-linked outer membrane protein n=1 Tax=unclassified Parabacteroides TaxID=2649774 RepID=UPI002475F5FF|nr:MULTISPECIES: TonB-dependent receptor [unclassified Parabacteroides]
MKKQTLLMTIGRSMLLVGCFVFLCPVLHANALYSERGTEKQDIAQQSITITGTITDEFGDGLPGVNIVEKGTTNGTLTDMNGKYSISVSSSSAVLMFSYVGFQTQEVAVGNQRTISLSMSEDSKVMDEIVVIGYGTQKKADVTSAVASVKSESFNKGAILDAGQLVQGKVAGLQITLASGDPAAATSVMLRGNSSINGTSDPLILVDGVPGSFSTVAPEEIESIDVLKDGSATAIYGTRGTNGVIIITTKGSKRDTPNSIDYNGYISISDIARTPDFMSASELRQRWSDGYSPSGANDKDYGATTDWLDEITQTGISHVHNLTFRGGGKQLGVIANLTYDKKEGTMKTSESENIRGRLELTHRMFDDRLTTNVSLIANEQVRSLDFEKGVYRQACIQNPTQPVYNDDGTYMERNVYFYDNPVSLLNEKLGEVRSRNIRFTGSMEFRPIESLALKAMYTRKGQSRLTGSYLTKKHPTSTEGSYNGQAYRYTSNYVNNLIELTASWNQTFDKHAFTAIVGYNYEDTMDENFSVTNRDFPTDSYTYNNLETGMALAKGIGGTGAWSYKGADKLIGLFARVTYNFDDRYLLMASLRREGSSKFGDDHKWGYFPGASVGWRINEEEFMEDYSWLDNLKIRAGYGVTGINVGRRYESLASINYEGYFLYNGAWTNTLTPVRNPNPDLRWEKKYEYNVGIDFDLFGGRFGGAVDAYLRDTKDALFGYTVPVPPYIYSSIMANVGEIRNQGIEVLLNAIPVQTKHFEWSTNMSYSTNKNKLRSISNEEFQMSTDYYYPDDVYGGGYTGEPIQQWTHIVKVGQPIGNFWGLKSVGLSSEGKWVVERLKKDDQGNTVGTYYDYAENAGDEDKQKLGNGVPKHFLNWNNTLRFKNFDLSINMRGAFGFEILNFQKMYYGNPTIQYNVLNSAFDKLPVVDLATGNQTGDKIAINDSQRYVSEYVEKGNYWKIDNVTLGYTFNLKTKYVKNLRVYASCMNLATITGYDGIDPEIEITGLWPGTDQRDKYPTVRSYTFGINATF